MKFFIKVLIFFLVLTVVTPIFIDGFNVTFGIENFWNFHGLFFLLLITAFPRLTLLFSSVPFGGLFWWLGFVFAPRFLVAILATVSYWQTNKMLVIVSWIVCLGGESTEKVYLRKEANRKFRGRVIDAEFEVK